MTSHVATQGARGRNSREDVVAAALEILDDSGLPDLTMRRIAAALAVQPSALYWHFPNKQLLLAALSDRITAVVAPAQAVTWNAALVELGTALREALLSHRDAAELVSSSYALGLADLAPREAMEAICRAGGVRPDLARAGADTLTHYVLGHVFHEQQRMYAESLGVVSDSEGIAAMEVVPTAQEEFSLGLSLITSGLASHAADNNAALDTVDLCE